MTSDRTGERPRIGINAHLLTGSQGYRRAGIHNYITQLIRHMARVDSGYDFTIYCNTHRVLADTGLDLVSTRWPTQRPLGRIMWEQLAWPFSARRHRLDLLHSMAFVTPIAPPAPGVVTVYDLSFIHYPELFPRLRRAYLASQTRRSCRSARRVIAISGSSRQDVHQLFDVPLERIDVVSPGVDPAYHPRSANEVTAFRQKHELPDRYILHVGTLQPRKNIGLLIEAYADLERDDIALVLIGGKGWFFDDIFERVRAMNLEHRILFPGYVPDADLPLWYNAAAVLTFPSYYEGFGIPILEAMASGTPVIAAMTSAIPEVTGDAALLFDPQDGSDLSEHLAAVLDEPKLAAKMRERGMSRVKRFSWQRAADEMIAVYRKALTES
ncbi:MAG: glycosyltransferase family 4 protein [Chloroflexota bacterium]|nr:MAG: glycosyltransferase family 4 protein [Chloroflexota bacterium]